MIELKYKLFLFCSLFPFFGKERQLEEKKETCPHCGGSGECSCPVCAPGRADGPYWDEIDSGRQDEGVCQMCEGTGRILTEKVETASVVSGGVIFRIPVA